MTPSPAATRSATTATTSADARAFAEQGYLLVRKLIPDEVLAEVRHGIAATVDAILHQLHATKAIPDTWRDEPFERRFAAAGSAATKFGRSWRHLVASPGVFRLYRQPQLLAVLRDITGRRNHGHPVFNARPKLPGQGLTVVPWHQDIAYYDAIAAGSVITTCWLPLVPVSSANGCMQVVPGSHHAGPVPHRKDVGEGAFLEIEQALPSGIAPVTCAMQPGDALFMHRSTWHRSTENHSDGIRWSIDLRYIAEGDPGTEGFIPRPWVLDGDEAIDLDTWLGWARTWGW